jgi:membrane protein YdbS with pleckstrin-like domain
MSQEESTVWQGTPSQLVNIKVWLICSLVVLIAIYLAFAHSWQWIALSIPAIAWVSWVNLETKHHVYRLSTERLSLTSGVISKRHDDLELYRVKDTTLEEPFLMRIFQLGNIVLDTSDRSTPQVRIHAIREAKHVREILRTNIEELRTEKKVREVDFE